MAGKVVIEKHLDPTVPLDKMSREEIRAYVKRVTDLGVDYPLDMVVETRSPGARAYREVFLEETST
jgi:hypothetical protein